jgi:hypothetical protein
LQALLEKLVFMKENVANVKQILDSINTHTRALKALKLPKDDTWDTILIYCMTLKLDKLTHQELEILIASMELQQVFVNSATF